jgi:hypothetical protein
MTRATLANLLQKYKQGTISADEVIDEFSSGISEPLGFATVDHLRELRQGFPEVIFAAGKTERQTGEIARSIVRRGGILFVTRASRPHYAAVKKVLRNARYNSVARTISGNESRVEPRGEGTILILTAGTSDLPVAEEALETARIMGNHTEIFSDLGVAGIHRLFSRSRELRNAAVIIVVAGMEGALPSVVGGLVRVPVIAVPTSVGYGASFGGISALLGMLNSCAAGVTVVNIDNGFGAGFAASLMNRKRTKA